LPKNPGCCPELYHNIPCINSSGRTGLETPLSFCVLDNFVVVEKGTEDKKYMSPKFLVFEI
jgi:hypothetical protein